MSLHLKSIISLIMLAQAVLALYSMFEIMGCEKSRFNMRFLRQIHMINGYIFLTLCIVIAYYCLPFLRAIRGEMSVRSLLHSLFSIGAIAMLMLKILFIRRYKKFMNKVTVFGLSIFFLILGSVLTSGGYYLVVSAETPPTPQELGVTQPDQTEVKKGEELFSRWCMGCHRPDSTVKGMGPGLKGILKNEKLPVSGKPATQDNVRRQLRTPYQFMPPQTHLTDKEVEHLIEFLKTL